MRIERSHLSLFSEMAQIKSILVDSSKTDFPLLCIVPTRNDDQSPDNLGTYKFTSQKILFSFN